MLKVPYYVERTLKDMVKSRKNGESAIEIKVFLRKEY
jgi:hypothetical protein